MIKGYDCMSTNNFKIGNRVIGLMDMFDDSCLAKDQIGTIVEVNMFGYTVNFDNPEVKGWKLNNEYRNCVSLPHDGVAPLFTEGDRVKGIRKVDNCYDTLNVLGTVIKVCHDYHEGVVDVMFDNGLKLYCCDNEIIPCAEPSTEATANEVAEAITTAMRGMLNVAEDEPEELAFKKGDYVRMKGQDHIYKVIDISPNGAILLIDKADCYRVFDNQIELVAWYE